MIFLTPDEIKILTGRTRKQYQIEQLRKMRIPFYLNAAGWPIIAKAVIEGSQESVDSDKPWRPAVLAT